MTGYACSEALLSSPHLSSDMDAWAPPGRLSRSWIEEDLRPKLSRQMLFLDPPCHTRQRRLVAPHLTVRRTRTLRPSIRQTADRLLHAIGAGASGTAELLEDFAYPLAITTLCQTAGFPDSFRRSYQHRRLFTAGILAVPEGAASRALNAANHRAMLALFEQVIQSKRRQPQDDLLTRLIESEDQDGGLSHDELTSMLAQLVIAGVEPVARFIAHAAVVLLDHPDQLADLRDHPALVPTATDELLRFISPNGLAAPRFVAGPTNLCGTALAAHDEVCVVLYEANRDPLRFTDPHQLDLRRDQGPHLAFGKGIHHCPGAALAHLQGQIALTTLLENLPDLSLAVPRHAINMQEHLPNFRGPAAVPISWKRG
ncbi:cytochrome P450 [Nonomuraea sp. NPDC050153]|uniref:cytochrome P450 n=1 Tax=Nonomuraea sp. NPDC050153 TaxID=3364359 RepID=UPI0037AB8776